MFYILADGYYAYVRTDEIINIPALINCKLMSVIGIILSLIAFVEPTGTEDLPCGLG